MTAGKLFVVDHDMLKVIGRSKNILLISCQQLGSYPPALAHELRCFVLLHVFHVGKLADASVRGGMSLAPHDDDHAAVSWSEVFSCLGGRFVPDLWWR